MPGRAVVERYASGVDNSSTDIYMIAQPVGAQPFNQQSSLLLTVASVGSSSSAAIFTAASSFFNTHEQLFAGGGTHKLIQGWLDLQEILYADPIFPITIDYQGSTQTGLIWQLDVVTNVWGFLSDFGYSDPAFDNAAVASLQQQISYASGPEHITLVAAATNSASTAFTPGPGLTQVGQTVSGGADAISQAVFYSPTLTNPSVSFSPSAPAALLSFQCQAIAPWWTPTQSAAPVLAVAG